MTLNKNNTIMRNVKNCIQLDATRKMKIKLDPAGNILYVNSYFTEVTNLKVHELILQDFNKILDEDMPAFTIKKIMSNLSEKPKSYFILKGKTKDNNCFWGYVRATQEFKDNGELKGYLLEIKMLPFAAIEKIGHLYEILKEIGNNAGLAAAEKYLDGYLEDRNMDLDSFIFNITGTNEKKVEKYFEIDVDAEPVKKKKSWF